MAVTTAAGVLRSWAAVGGMGRVRVVCCPAGRRMCAVMVPAVRVAVTSVSSSRVMRLRSRAGVAGSSQIAGRSVASCRIRVFWASVSCPVSCLRACSYAFWAWLRARRAVFQSASRVPATSRLAGVDGKVAAAGQVGVAAGALDVGGA